MKYALLTFRNRERDKNLRIFEKNSLFYSAASQKSRLLSSDNPFQRHSTIDHRR